MTEQTNLDQRPRLPYSIGTGIPKHGQAEIEGYLQSLRLQGFCVIERVIPAHRSLQLPQRGLEGMVRLHRAFALR